MKSTDPSIQGQQESNALSDKTNQGLLTPLGALSNLQRDPRERRLFVGDHALLKILVQRCEKATGEVRDRALVDIARACGWRSERTVRRHLQYLNQLEILVYVPGGTQGRGSLGKIMLLYESWGNTKTIYTKQSPFKERRTPMSPFPAPKQGHSLHSNSTPHGKKVEYTQPFIDMRGQHDALPFPHEEKQALELAKEFYDRVGIHKQSLSKVDIQTAAYIRYHYNRKHRNKALNALLTYYKKKYRRKKIRGIGILRFYCENLNAIEAGLKLDGRALQWHRDQAKKRERQKSQTQETHNQKAKRIEQAQQKIAKNPWDSWSRAELRLPLYPTDEEISKWKQQPFERFTNNEAPSDTRSAASVNQANLSKDISLGFCHDWAVAISRLRQKLFKTSFNTWIRPLVPLSHQGDIWKIRAPTDFSARWVKENYLDDLVGALGGNACVCFEGEVAARGV